MEHLEKTDETTRILLFIPGDLNLKIDVYKANKRREGIKMTKRQIIIDLLLKSKELVA